MFTGIIEATGSISELNRKSGDMQLTVKSTGLDLSDVKIGDSIATNGVCLTVVSLLNNGFVADVSNETLENTCFRYYSPGQTVNLEKAMLPTTRFGGHIVSGHVDAIAQIESISKNARSIDIWINLPAELSQYVVKKGSITIDGISLTVNEVSQSSVKLTIVPHTQLETTISQLLPGGFVNIEVDLIARYLEKLINKPKSGVTLDLLSQSGFIK